MRLIDADNIISICEILSEKCNDQHYWNQLISIIKDVPTVDAIPVEWFNQKYAENDPNTHEEDYDYYLWNAIAYILTLWREEQEAE